MNITRNLCKAFYLEFTNNYLTLDVFAEHQNALFNMDKPVSYWSSIISRGSIAFNGASYNYFTGANMPFMRPDNRVFFNNRRIERLLQEHSA